MKTYYIRPKNPSLETVMGNKRREFIHDIYSNPGLRVEVTSNGSSTTFRSPKMIGFNGTHSWTILSIDVNKFLQATPPDHFDEELFKL